MSYTSSIGIIQNLKGFFDANEKDHIDQMVDAGIETVQILANSICLDMLTEENAEKLLKMTEGKIRITSFWAGWCAPGVWDFVDGPGT